ncbi:MAG: GNAT family N-acetyltransferase [Planctomycetes bacterium]|nr:GNAT family N-acetyltransferase [Planctomycetota bacterium]MBI3848105.1 GNAT family N-acetyltransferase [Planctomycetota bacterium]
MKHETVKVRPLLERDLDEADRIFRLAFGTFIGLPDPMAFGGDAAYVRPRWNAAPKAALAAEVGGRLVGSNFAARWGSVAFFGPLTIHPEYWNRGVAQALLRGTMKIFSTWRVRHSGLFTFSNSAKHVGLYQKFGFHPRYLTPLFARAAERPARPPKWTRLSGLSEDRQQRARRACRALTGRIYPGLDLSFEITLAASQRQGDTILLGDPERPSAFAVCHHGAGSEAGSGVCYVKFGAASPGRGAAAAFGRLLDAVDEFAISVSTPQVTFGVNAAREEAYRAVVRRGYRADRAQGVIMERGRGPGYNRPGVYLIDDWR